MPDSFSVKQSPTGRVMLTGDVAGEYRISEQRPDGTLVLEPETAARASLRRLGAAPANKAEFDAFVESGVLPPDGESPRGPA